ncbi:hypothetical protein WHT83_06175 [Aminobacter sp. P9b]|uniref:hypothetical protein n=1 Tax=Aminobacter sp. P9b TaxID=3133697 RepID=UPI0032456D7D
MESMTTSERIASNVLLLAVARLSMALALPTLGLLLWLYSSWQDAQLEMLQTQINQTQHSAQEASQLALKLSDRLIAVETKQVQDAASSEKFQSATLTRLDRVQDSIVGLSNTVAALTATLQSIVNDKQSRTPP